MNKKKKKPWFAVSEKGLRDMLSGKKKTFIIRELVQNCWDEPISYCKVDITWNAGRIQLSVEDDSPEGFRNIEHAYTLFADTYKRSSPIHRGRINIGEKLVLAICINYGAEISTTKGTIEFHPVKGRIHHWSIKRERGSIFKGTFRATKAEYQELIDHAKSLLSPTNIDFYINQEKMQPKSIFKSFKCTLDTEIYNYEIDNWKTLKRKTEVHLIESDGQSYVFEMGIPIMATDCKWHIDVQQRVPLTLDRESIRPSYLKVLYAEVLNHTHKDIPDDEASVPWVRAGFTDKRTNKTAVETIFQKRYGDKYLSKNPFDPNANDEAISHGYHLINGAELSKEEWKKLKENDLIQSSTELYGKTSVPGTDVSPTQEQQKFAHFVKKVAKEFLGIDIIVKFMKAPVQDGAYFDGVVLIFIVNRLPKDFFDGITEENQNLMIHELGHKSGNHTEHAYHQLLTRLAAQLIIRAIKDPSFFK